MECLRSIAAILTNLVALTFDQEHERARLKGIRHHRVVCGTRGTRAVAKGINESNPRHAGSERWQAERNFFMMTIQQQDEVLISDELTAFINFVDGGTREENPEGTSVFLVPFLIGHLAAVGTKPQDIFDSCVLNGPFLEEIAASEDGIVLAERD
jgi:hypothetical protein